MKLTYTPPVANGAAQATAVPGLYKLMVNSKLSEEPLITYWVQLPPEYDPYRRYPCILTLNGAVPLVTLALKSTTGAAGVLLTVIAEETVLVTVPPSKS
jgi:hypothetical protein